MQNCKQLSNFTPCHYGKVSQVSHSMLLPFGLPGPFNCRAKTASPFFVFNLKPKVFKMKKGDKNAKIVNLQKLL
jgi:hypothetical protein